MAFQRLCGAVSLCMSLRARAFEPRVDSCRHSKMARWATPDVVQIHLNGVSRVSTNGPNSPARLPWQPQGYETWTYTAKKSQNSLKINYVAQGLDLPGIPIVLIHGFGASAFHWRHNVPTLAKERPVFALDLIGFGLSDKPLIDYDAELWRDQICAFLDEVVREPAILVGNSLGGFTALYTAASFPDRVAACVLLNAAGRFSSPDGVVETAGAAGESEASGKLSQPVVQIHPAATGGAQGSTLGAMATSALASLQRQAVRAVVHGSFHISKQPARIRQVLRQVYPVDWSRVDAELVESIRFPAFSSPNTAEIFYRVVTRTSNDGYGAPEGSAPGASQRATPTIDQLLPLLTAANTPLWLVWGEADPWIKPEVANRIQRLKPDAVRVSVAAGHCPHDEAPHEVNAALCDVGAAVDASRDATAASRNFT